ncbi:MAG: tRNA (guanine(46)-N(7))-methyltransferase TrmB [Acidobacteriia bacterium]|nr:tRNA (guanine(46)-N(7))-methyltransferase TrmB [Terriglobia bacterium]
MDVGATLLDLGSVELPLDATRLFGGSRPVEAELGVGKGRFLLAWAARHPEVGFIGVERARKYLELTAIRSARAGLTNVRLVHSTAEDLVFRCVRPGTLAALHIYFPDPWPKRRHHKRRFFHPENVARLAAVLAPSGVLRIKTDHAGYAAVIAEVLAAEPRLAPIAVAEAFEEIPASNFEIKYAREARAVHRFAYCRV